MSKNNKKQAAAKKNDLSLTQQEVESSNIWSLSDSKKRSKSSLSDNSGEGIAEKLYFA